MAKTSSILIPDTFLMTWLSLQLWHTKVIRGIYIRRSTTPPPNTLRFEIFCHLADIPKVGLHIVKCWVITIPRFLMIWQHFSNIMPPSFSDFTPSPIWASTMTAGLLLKQLPFSEPMESRMKRQSRTFLIWLSQIPAIISNITSDMWNFWN